MMEPGERRDGSTRLKKNVSKIAFRGKEKVGYKVLNRILKFVCPCTSAVFS